MLTPACLRSRFCLGSMPGVRWVWPCARGSQGFFLLPSEEVRVLQL